MQNNIQRGRLRSLSDSSRVVSTALGFISVALPALSAYLISHACVANLWFSILLAVAVGMLGLAAFSTWKEDEAPTVSAKDGRAYVILAAVLSFVGIALTYITLNIYPFGDHTVLIIDMHHQYVEFLSLLRSRLLGGGSLIYSDTLGLGTGFLPLFAYYLASPFNILTVLFPAENITEAIALITMLKITAGGATFATYVRYMYKRSDYLVTIGGVAYSLMAFFVCHSWNIMWLDPLILLPLVVLGLERLLRTGKPLLYCITLALTMYTNYYIGYMICVFLVFYYFAHAIANGANADAPTRARRFWRFCYGSLIGGGLSAFIVVPAFIYLQSTSGADDSFARNVGSNFNLFSLFQRSLFSAYPSMRGDSLPNIYCSTLAVFLLVLFLGCRGISARKRAAWTGLAGVVMIGMAINWTNFAWHGFHFPNDLPYRFSFLLSFVMISIAVQTLDKISKITGRDILRALIAVIALFAVEQLCGDEFSTFMMVYVSLAFIIAYAVILALYTSGRIKQGFCYALLLIFLFSEVTANASLLMEQLDQKEYFTEKNAFVGDMEIDAITFDTINGYKAADGALGQMYREEMLPRKTCNDPSLFGYSGLTVFASSNRESVTDTMGYLGYAVNGVNSYLYENFVPVSDSMLGLKYLVLDKQINGHNQLEYLQEVHNPDNTDARYIHVNNTALSKAYMVDNSIVGWNYSSPNPFEVQNSLLSSAGAFGEAFTLHYYDSGNTDGYLEDYVDNYFENPDNANPDIVLPEEPVQPAPSTSDTSVSGYNCNVSINGTYFISSLISESMLGNFSISRTITEPGQYFMYIDCRAAESTNITYTTGPDGAPSTINSQPNEPRIVDLGYLSAGAIVTADISSEISCGGNLYLASLNDSVLKDAVAVLRSGELAVETYRENSISGIVHVENDGMMFTSIPYDSGWTVKVDGKKVSTFALGEAFLCFAVPAGNHTVSMSYFPVGLIIGLVISLICLALLIAITNRRVNEWLHALFIDSLKERLYSMGKRNNQPEEAMPAPEYDSDSAPDGFESDIESAQ